MGPGLRTSVKNSSVVYLWASSLPRMYVDLWARHSWQIKLHWKKFLRLSHSYTGVGMSKQQILTGTSYDITYLNLIAHQCKWQSINQDVVYFQGKKNRLPPPLQTSVFLHFPVTPNLSDAEFLMTVLALDAIVVENSKWFHNLQCGINPAGSGARKVRRHGSTYPT